MQTDFSGEYKVRNSYGHMNKHIFESTLELPRVDYMYVGFYHCVKNSTKSDANLETLVRNNEASSIYLFIEGNSVSIRFLSIENAVVNQSDPKKRSNLKSNNRNMISDSDHPLANVNVPIVQGNRYEDVVIPCKPTSKNIEVQLIKDGDEVILHSNFIFRSD